MTAASGFAARSAVSAKHKQAAAEAAFKTSRRIALVFAAGPMVWSISNWEFVMAYVIAEPCIGTKDTACVDACPVDCIHPKKDEPGYADSELLYIDPVECIDCGACVPVCPVSAIFALDDLPEKWADFTAKNAAYYGR
ncbi:MAG TPA: ferredoxin family protein [Bryobacteraceae bacterium]|nr:ferredoxin family protein [Bryobacteraceae bacterium]